MLREIERMTQQKIQVLNPPSLSELHKVHLDKLKVKVFDTLSKQNLERYSEFVEQICHDSEMSPFEIAAALSWLLDKGKANQTRDNLQEAMQADRDNPQSRREGGGQRRDKGFSFTKRSSGSRGGSSRSDEGRG